MSEYVPKPDPEGINSPKSENQFLDAMILLVVFFGIITMISFAFISVTDMVMSQMSLETEIKWFGEKDLLTDLKEDSPGLQAIVSKVNSQSDFPLRVSILCSNEPNAFAFLGGQIFVTSGLLAEMESENGLVFILGHEMGHVVHRDNVRNLGRKAMFQIMAIFLGFGDVGNLATFQQLISLGYDRNLENQADDYALQLMHKVYGHNAGADEFFQRMAAKESTFEKNIARFASTHPSSEDRLQKLRQAWIGSGERTLISENTRKEWATLKSCR